MTEEAKMPVAPATEKPPRHYPPFDTRDRVYLILFTLLALLLANFWFVGGFRLGFTISVLLLIGTSLLYLKDRIRYTPFPAVCLLSSVVTLISFSVFENGTFTAFKVLFLLLALSLFYVSACGLPAPALTDFRALLAPFYLFFGISCNSLGDTFGAVGQKKNNRPKQILMALIAICCVLPVFGLLLLLLASADAAFESLVSSIDLNFTEWFATLLLGVIFLLFGFPIVFTLSKRTEELKASQKGPYASVLHQTFTNTFLGAIALLYLAFCASQFSYLSGGFAGVRPEAYTFSEYARRGFGEMCAVCVINLTLLFLSETLTKRTDGNLPLFTRILHIFICAFSLFFVLASFAKMFLYIRTYGLTVLRLGTSIFMLFLFFIFTACILHTLRPAFPHIRMIVISLCVIMTVFSALDPNLLIVKFNTHAYESGMHEKLDMRYLAECGDVAVPTLIAYATGENGGLAADAQSALFQEARYGTLGDHFDAYRYSESGTVATAREYDFRGYSYAYAKAHALLDQYSSDIFNTWKE